MFLLIDYQGLWGEGVDCGMGREGFVNGLPSSKKRKTMNVEPILTVLEVMAFFNCCAFFILIIDTQQTRYVDPMLG